MSIEGVSVQGNLAERRFEMETSAGPAIANYRWD